MTLDQATCEAIQALREKADRTRHGKPLARYGSKAWTKAVERNSVRADELSAAADLIAASVKVGA